MGLAYWQIKQNKTVIIIEGDSDAERHIIHFSENHPSVQNV